jgi:hypothetical protein
VRLPVGALLLAADLLSILSFPGIWMAPLGPLLLAQDLLVLRRPTEQGMISDRAPLDHVASAQTP